MRPTSKANRRADADLVQAIVRAQAWNQQLSDGTYESIENLAAAHGMHVKVFRKAIRLGFLTPDIVAAILAVDPSSTIRQSGSQSGLPLSWLAQRQSLQSDLGPLPRQKLIPSI